MAWAIEGTRSYGAGLARYLAAAGEQVAEIDGSHCLGKRRAGKRDASDAFRAARELLARPHAALTRQRATPRTVAKGRHRMLSLARPGRQPRADH